MFPSNNSRFQAAFKLHFLGITAPSSLLHLLGLKPVSLSRSLRFAVYLVCSIQGILLVLPLLPIILPVLYRNIRSVLVLQFVVTQPSVPTFTL